jgi:hypothetical protein
MNITIKLSEKSAEKLLTAYKNKDSELFKFLAPFALHDLRREKEGNSHNKWDLHKLFFTICLHHFRGLDNYVREILGLPDFVAPFSQRIDPHKDLSHRLMWRIISDLWDYIRCIWFHDCHKEFPGRDRIRLLELIRKHLGMLIDTEKLWDEHILTRDPLKKCENAKERSRTEIAACTYLLRGYCAFETGQSPFGKDINCVKGALNDFTQAFYLTLRLLSTDCSNSDYRWLLILNEFFKGNTYFKLYAFGVAMEHYSRGLQEYDRFNRNTNHYCKTIAKVNLEYAKTLYEKGLFIKSLYRSLLALRDLLEISNSQGNTKQIQAIERVVNYLAENQRLLLDKAELWKQFEQNNGLNPALIKSAEVREDLKHLMVRVLTHIEFLLYIIRKHSLDIAGYDTDVLNEMKEHYRLIEFGDQRNLLMEFLDPESLGYGKEFITAHTIWARMTLAETAAELASLRSLAGEHSFGEDMGRNVARLIYTKLLETVKRERGSPIKDAVDFAKNLGVSSMVSIDNMVTTRKMIHGFLMRGGYRTRLRETHYHGLPEMMKGANKLVILRRWQSFNPKVPRPRGISVKGGGYFLRWNDYGIVIDPGYGFVQNFYDEGFSLEDIQAIIVTHSHPDHEEELATLLTLIYEWNDHWRMMGMPEKKITVALFLNEGSFRKYAGWIFEEKVCSGRVTELVSSIAKIGSEKLLHLRRHSDPKYESEWCRQLPNFEYPIYYGIRLEVVPAIHEELHARSGSIGLKFHLSYENGKNLFRIGFTGDTRYYNKISWMTTDSDTYIGQRQQEAKSLPEEYADCDIVVAHIGDVKIKEVCSKDLVDIDILAEDSLTREQLFGYSGGDVAYSEEKLKDLIFTLVSLDLLPKPVHDVFNEDERIAYSKILHGEGVGREILERLAQKLLGSCKTREYHPKQHLGLKMQNIT